MSGVKTKTITWYHDDVSKVSNIYEFVCALWQKRIKVDAKKEKMEQGIIRYIVPILIVPNCRFIELIVGSTVSNSNSTKRKVDIVECNMWS